MIPRTTRPRHTRRPVQQQERPVFLDDRDVDYVDTFRTTAYVNRLIELRGATTGRLLRRSALYHALGDFAQSADDAVRLLTIDPKSGEGHFRLGAACVGLALQDLRGLPSGPGAPKKPREEGPHRLLVRAHGCFLQACRSNPEDEEAKQALKTTHRLLVQCEHRDAGWSGQPRQGPRRQDVQTPTTS